MTELNVTRTKATPRSSDWLRGALGIFGAVVLALFLEGILIDSFAEEELWRVVAAMVGTLIVGTIWAARQVGPPRSSRRFLACMLMPMPTLLLAVPVLLLAGAMGGAMGEMPFYWVALFLLLEIPLGVALVLLAALEQRKLPAPSGRPAPAPLDRQLAAATQNGRSATVIREYIDDPAGQELLEGEEVALLDHGYGLVSIDLEPAPEGLRRDLGQLYDVLTIFSWSLPSRGEGANEGRIMATFQRDLKEHPSARPRRGRVTPALGSLPDRHEPEGT